ncbi:hypothetical protein [Leptolyngbya sp. FACHB-17]|uniref:hypothetical protein n=1 Tax=unclassified Leptolyngbya TaxID=2650499 RepID=UPI00167FFBFF|nr:hypothetical protein [Leptolyngbya sp. FACHB-17]MBD2080614.1 hypothetical protein [Leptolyngbya sp. FACHB-17]
MTERVELNQSVTDAPLEEVHEEVAENTVVASDVQASLETLEAHLTELENSLEEEIQQTIDSLEPLAEKAQALESQATESINEARSHYSTLNEQVNQKLEEIQSKTEELQGEFEEISNHIQTVEQELETQVTESLHDVNELQTVVETMKGSVEARKTALIAQFDQFGQETRIQIRSLVDAFTTLADSSEHRLTEFETLLDTTSTENLDRLSHHFTDEILGKLTQSSQELTHAIDVLGQAGDGVHDQLDGSIGGIVDQIGEVTRLIEDIKPVLDLVEKML